MGNRIAGDPNSNPGQRQEFFSLENNEMVILETKKWLRGLQNNTVIWQRTHSSDGWVKKNFECKL